VEVLQKDKNVVAGRDLISTGNSSLQAVEAFAPKASYNVEGMAAIFTYGFAVSEENFKNTNNDFFCEWPIKIY
jgi:orotate phosphoribosyltransferase